MKAIIVIILCLSTTGCGHVARSFAGLFGYSRECVNGVSYLQFTSGAALEVDINGKPVACR